MAEQELKNPEELSAYTLFGGSIGYNSPSDFDSFIKTIDRNTALRMLVCAVNFAQTKGIFTLPEAEILSTSIKTFTRSVDEPKTETENTTVSETKTESQSDS